MDNHKDSGNIINNNANETSHYSSLAIGIAIGIVGILLRFLTNWELVDIVSDTIFIIGIVICLLAVAKILR